MKGRYLYLPGGCPAIVHEEDRARYERHTLLGVYTDPNQLIVAYDSARASAVARIAAARRPNPQPGTGVPVDHPGPRE